MSKSKAREVLPTREEWRRNQPQMPRPVPPFDSPEYQEFRVKMEAWAAVGRKLDLQDLPKTGSISKKEWNNAV